MTIDAAGPRTLLSDAKRIVIKIGSKSIARSEGGGRFEEVAAQLAPLREGGRAVFLVSSGAIALGFPRLGLRSRPDDLPLLQASAAAGQSLLMRAYEDAFSARGVPVAQILLTHADLADRDRYLNARAALDALVDRGAIPIINENDTVSVDEIKFGDNDQLAAMLATLVGADLLILMTDVEGVLDERGARIPTVDDPAALAAIIRPTKSELGSGGMESKARAAQNATVHGVPVVIADARDPVVISKILAGEDVGTLFLPQGARLPSRKHWIAFTLKPRGTLIIDDGAAEAIRHGGRSLLPSGLVGVRGDFEVGDAIRILTSDGTEIARGLARYATLDVARLAGAKSHEIEVRLGRRGETELVHRDDLILMT